ncbi:Protein CBG00533 [Caenorhabditis briggsae]|nr:Protein CBG00533 [Caenorhabditis briggsae]CAP22092.1 Protein CBG00533 [Caenorhabditis briggsae]
MPFPTLSQLAAKSIAQGIHDETISLDSVLDTKSSNAIVRELLTLDGNNFEKLKVFKNQLSITDERHELSISLFSADIPDMIELFYNVFNKNSLISFKKETAEFVFRMLEATVNAVRPGILIPDRVLSFVFDKTVDLVRQFPEHRSQAIRIILQAEKWMSWEQVLTIGI